MDDEIDLRFENPLLAAIRRAAEGLPLPPMTEEEEKFRDLLMETAYGPSPAVDALKDAAAIAALPPEVRARVAAALVRARSKPRGAR
jgi:hypothetical protein